MAFAEQILRQRGNANGVTMRPALTMKTAATQNDSSDRSLESAFEQFSQCSQELIATYQLLQEQVSHLTAELEIARKARLQELREKEKLASRLDGLMDVLPAGVVLVDENDAVVEANPAAQELLGSGIVGGRWQHLLENAAEHHAPVTGELLLSCGKWVSLSSTGLSSEGGHLYLLADVSQTHRLQEQLAHHKRLSAMGEMTAQLAHQIRTPLTSALLSIDYLRRSADRGRVEKAVRRIESRLHSLEQLVNDMLLFARREEVEKRSVNVAELLLQFEQRSRERYGDNVRVQTECRGDLLISGNGELLFSALDNLIHNAVNAAGFDVRICMRARLVDDGWIQIDVVDNGPGVPEEIGEQVFAPFFTTRRAGTGLGLAVVKGIIEAHGGEIRCITPCDGACFRIRLPQEGAALLSDSRDTRTASARTEG